MIKKVCVIDYGAGNLKSISKALTVLGLDVTIFTPHLPSSISNSPSTLSRLPSTDLLVLPGVGEFGSAMKILKIIKSQILDFINSDKPLLGICLGIQLLFEKSEENRTINGLGILEGEVVRFNFNNQLTNKPFNHSNLPIPHMCWNKVCFNVGKGNKENILKKKLIIKGLNKEEYFYFVHSYYPVPKNKNICFGETDYGIKFCSMIVKDNIVATQFHLEKSGTKGLLLLKNILSYFEKI